MKKTMTIQGYPFPVTGQVESKVLGRSVPVLGIPQMSDERWNELAEENAVGNYIRVNGRPPESTEQALIWQRLWVENMLIENGQKHKMKKEQEKRDAERR